MSDTAEIKYKKNGKPKKRWGDRNDGFLVRDTDSLHVLFPHIYPDRTDNEALAHVEVNIDKLEAYIEEKNKTAEHKYTFFHAVVAALGKVLIHYPKMNRFYEGRRYYQHYRNSVSFVARNKMTLDSHESLLDLDMPDTMEEGESLLEYTHEFICRRVYKIRNEKVQDHATDTMDILRKIPWWLLRVVIGFLRWLNFHGRYPIALQKDEPSCASIFISNLGSIKLSAEYHHLSNWGTNSVFVVISEKKRVPFYHEDGTYEMHTVLPLGITLDERIADGYYFSKALGLLKTVLENPELLDRPIQEKVEL